MINIIKPAYKNIRLRFGMDPVVEKTGDYQKFIPKPYKAALIICADFELAWAWRFSTHINSSKEASDYASRERKNIPVILDLCDNYNIPLTWATVGHLFLGNCNKINGIAHPEIKQIKKFKNIYWNFDETDWFVDDPCSNNETSPGWYAPDLIELIMNSKTGHEVACHTFSHINCSEEVCSSESFESELSECVRLAKNINIDLKSFVYPGNITGYKNSLTKFGITSFRTDNYNVLGYPQEYERGFWEIKSSSELVFNKNTSQKFLVKYYCNIINKAVETNTVCYLWFHPSASLDFPEKILKPIFDFIRDNADNIFISTSRNYIDWLNRR